MRIVKPRHNETARQRGSRRAAACPKVKSRRSTLLLALRYMLHLPPIVLIVLTLRLS